jgi:hypothetical protein
MKALFIALQQASGLSWTPVARVVKDGGLYRLAYTKGALELPNFSGFGRMSDLNKEYVSNELFPLLRNRVLPRNRPEYKHYLNWLGFGNDEHDALDELARTGGLRATDSIELIPAPEPTGDGLYEAFFFIRGIRHLPQPTITRISDLQVGERLFVVKDVQNEHDPNALLLRTGEPVSLVGYAPRYYTRDFSELVSGTGVRDAQVVVDRINVDAPLPYRVLCRIRAPWPSQFLACDSPEFQSLNPMSASDELRRVEGGATVLGR